MVTKESASIIPSVVADSKDSSVLQAERDEMANAKEFDVRHTDAPISRGCRPGPCLTPTCTRPPPCIVPPKCGQPPRPRPSYR